MPLGSEQGVTTEYLGAHRPVKLLHESLFDGWDVAYRERIKFLDASGYVNYYFAILDGTTKLIKVEITFDFSYYSGSGSRYEEAYSFFSEVSVMFKSFKGGTASILRTVGRNEAYQIIKDDNIVLVKLEFPCTVTLTYMNLDDVKFLEEEARRSAKSLFPQ
jgi:hypothetical protein